MEVQWYPGHMARANRLINDSLKQVDAVCEIVDARIPRASRNPDLNKLALRKPRVIILNRADLADPKITAQWAEYFRARGCAAVITDCQKGSGISEFYTEVRRLLTEKTERYAERGMAGRAIKLMIVGVPNVGKSSFINKIIKKKAAAASNKPGVTRKNQWFAVEDGIEMLDTPGVLSPKIADKKAGVLLACTGAIKEEILDVCELGSLFIYELSQINPGRLCGRYGENITAEVQSDDSIIVDPRINYGYTVLKRIADARGFLNRGGEQDVERAARTVLDEFQSGKLGRITLELPKV